VICRVWHGYTAPHNADAYESLLRGEIFPGIAGRKIPGYRGIHLLRRDGGGESEFVTLMWFENMEAIAAFAGPDLTTAVVPPAARALLTRFDERSAHFLVRTEPGLT
jgi:antibiotic biosynthesis monooxygenase (ABM) superfamily enzyme